MGNGLLIVLILIVIWVWYFQFNDPDFESVWLDGLIASKTFKTGDIILFKAQDNWNGPKIACYYGHIGVVFVDPDKPYCPMLFEAAGTRGMNLQAHQNKKGIFFEPLIQRLKKYKGTTYYKQLNKAIPSEIQRTFHEFVNYAKQNMTYEYSVGWSGVLKGLGIERCHHRTNCGEITMLSLIRLGVLAESEYDKPRPHHLRDMCYFEHGINRYCYSVPVRILIDPFS